MAAPQRPEGLTLRHIVMQRSPDASTPSVPTGLTAADGSAGVVNLTWDAAADPYTGPTGASGLKEYVLSRDGAYLASVASTPGLSLELLGADIGGFTPGGLDTQAGASHTLTAAGSEIYGTSDEFRYKYAAFTGDCTIIAKVTAFPAAVNDFAKAGVMFRASTDANAAFVHCMAFSFAFGRGVKTEYRASAGASAADYGANVPLTAAPRWLKLSRTGNSFAAAYSLDGNVWEALGTQSVTMPATALVGLAVSSQTAGSPVTAVFEDVGVQNLPAVTYSDMTATGVHSYRVAARDNANNTSAEGAAAVNSAAAEGIPLGMYWIGQGDLGSFTTMYQSAQGIEDMRRRKVVVINGWPELQGARGVSTAAIVASVKAASTIGTKVYVYMDTERVYKGSYTSAFATRQAYIAARNWYTYASGTGGTPIDSYFANNGYWINPTVFVPDDASGRNAMEWMADYEPTWMWGGAEGNEASTQIDGMFWDNTLVRPRQNGDLNRDGTIDDRTNLTVGDWYRAGIASGISRFKTNYPTKQALVNLAEFPNVGGSGWPANFGALTHYSGLAHGGVLEHIMGRSFSPETFMSTAQFVAAVQGSEDALIDPSLGIFNACPDDFSATNYQAMRHALACCLTVTNMSFGWTRHTEFQSDWDWYDEYDFPLGAPTETRKAYASGAIRRDYANGIVIWWPKGVTDAVSLGGTFYALQGNARGWLTAGQAVTSVTAPSARNGLILSRTPT